VEEKESSEERCAPESCSMVSILVRTTSSRPNDNCMSRGRFQNARIGRELANKPDRSGPAVALYRLKNTSCAFLPHAIRRGRSSYVPSVALSLARRLSRQDKSHFGPVAPHTCQGALERKTESQTDRGA